MVDPTLLALIHAEIDGELDDRQRAELSRGLLSDPALRALREEMQRLCRALDAVPQVEPPAQLRADIFAALPQISPRRSPATWASPKWRYAAVLAGILLTGAIVSRMMDFGQESSVNEMSGTLAARRTAVTVDMVQISDGGVSGRASLIREGAELALSLQLAANAPVDVLIASGEHFVRVNGLAAPGSPGAGSTRIALPGFGGGVGPIRLTFMRGDHQIGQAVLEEPTGH